MIRLVNFRFARQILLPRIEIVVLQLKKLCFRTCIVLVVATNFVQDLGKLAMLAGTIICQADLVPDF